MIITSGIELLLNYCTHFYDRQFITRKKVNKDISANYFDDLIKKETCTPNEYRKQQATFQ